LRPRGYFAPNPRLYSFFETISGRIWRSSDRSRDQPFQAAVIVPELPQLDPQAGVLLLPRIKRRLADRHLRQVSATLSPFSACCKAVTICSSL
jgi:hypothetical protein